MKTIKIASWNVNSVNARLENILFWLKESAPDVALLQEIKCVEENFPIEAIADLGYNLAVFGQKSYNGVAIISKFPIADVVKNFITDNGQNKQVESQEKQDQARYIEALICLPNCALRVASIYVPNGGAELSIGQEINQSEKFLYKMAFFDQLYSHLKHLLNYNEIAIFGGDYNVAAKDIDVYDPKALKETICFHPDEQKKFHQILNLGYVDSFRMLKPDEQSFTWWNYRGNSWAYNKGLRIDYLLASPKAADCLTSAYIESDMMNRQKPSDHCPVVLTLRI